MICRSQSISCSFFHFSLSFFLPLKKQPPKFCRVAARLPERCGRRRRRQAVAAAEKNDAGTLFDDLVAIQKKKKRLIKPKPPSG